MTPVLAQAAIQGASVDWANQTILHPVGLALVLVLGTLMLILPRRHAGLMLIVMACSVAPAQRLVVAGLDFNLLRIMVLFGWARLLMRNEFAGFRWHRLDTWVVAWAVVGSVIYTIQQGAASALIYKAGASFDAIGMYFLYRCLVRDMDDLVVLIKGLVLISIPVAGFLLLEKSTGRNMFAVFGGVSEITQVRFGKVRAQGPFSHAILAGTFWAALVPMMAALWWRRGNGRMFALIGVVTTIVIVIACASSTPMAALGAALFGALMWSMRHWMRWVRWGLLAMLLGLHVVMNKPVWHLIARIDLVGGSTGWHRYNLINQAIHRFPEWALFGTRGTAHWGYGLSDVTNHYVLEGVRGGFVTLVLFVGQIVIAFGAIGALRRVVQGDRMKEPMAWAMGVAMFVHVTAFIAVSYFGQIIVVWYMLLAICASLDPRRVPVAARSVTSQLGRPVTTKGTRLEPALLYKAGV